MIGVPGFLKKRLAANAEHKRFNLIIDSKGLNYSAVAEDLEACALGKGEGWLSHQFVALSSLEEQGVAERTTNGFIISSPMAVNIEDDLKTLLEIPGRFKGKFVSRITGKTGQNNFDAKLTPVLSNGDRISYYKLNGPCIQFSDSEKYLLSPPEFDGLLALDKHQKLSTIEKTEHENLNLICSLQEAKRAGMVVDLSHFNKLNVSKPKKVGFTAVIDKEGGMLLTPSYGTGSDPVDINKRLGQLKNKAKGTLRIRDQIVVLDTERMEATEEIVSNRRIPKHQVKEFIETPSAFLNPSLIDLDTGFSLRVEGATRFQFLPFGGAGSGGIKWFDSEEMLISSTDVIRNLVGNKEDFFVLASFISEAQGQGATEVNYEDLVIDISDPEKVAAELKIAATKIAGTENAAEEDDNEKEDLAEVDESGRFTLLLSDVSCAEDSLCTIANNSNYLDAIDYSKYARQPFPHQNEGIRWMLGMIRAGLDHKDDAEYIQGALLADDMGLGKTLMSLIGVSEYLKELKKRGQTEKPVLVVAPLSLVENWADEVDLTFSDSPFVDIVALQSGGDLGKFKIKGAKTETWQKGDDSALLGQDAIRYALKIGSEYGKERLDMPNRLVLATYQTLRDYQFSLCRIDWSIVIFDEAQNIKNPNALQTRSAKGLKADFKLLATGTPVENSLSDFWCLMDTAQPGLMGRWKEFRKTFITPINRAKGEEQDRVRFEVGQELRSHVGNFMLRRLKEDNIEGLPVKRIFTGVPVDDQPGISYLKALESHMVDVQRKRYDEVVENYRVAKAAKKPDLLALNVLMDLRELSLHPNLGDELDMYAKTAKESISVMGRSAKLDSVLNILNQIKGRKEKVIIFWMNKKLQRFMKLWLDLIFGLNISIINGDTQAVATKKISLTRKGLIAQFEAAPGFGIIIMSPVAAGVGLTVVGANNVIHLERHWNPAKEAQATDRVYRIGQLKDVNVYLPALHHPILESFDVNLDRLLQKKVSLKDAVVTPQEVTAKDMESVFSVT